MSLYLPPPQRHSPHRSNHGMAATAALLSLGVLLAVRRRIRRLRWQLDQALHKTHHDPLTGLPNREAALRRLATGPVGLVGLLDLDHFKTVNDRYGHRVGDILLITLAERLRTAINGDGMVARLSGDEFLLIWTLTPAHPIRQASLLLQQVCAPVTIDSHRLFLTASLGLARAGTHLHGPGPLIAAADEAMYDAKRAEGRASDEAMPQPRASLYRNQYPPEPIDRGVAGRRSIRDRPAGVTDAVRIGVEGGDHR